MAKQSSFLWHAAVYGGGNLLVYAAGFLLLPLYVRCLSESEYGTLDVFNRLGEVVILCLLYNGLRQALLRVGLSIVLVAGFGLGIEGVLIASAVTSGLFALVLLGREVVRGGLRIERRQLKAMTWFALPFVPGGLGFFLLNSGDRFFLLHHVAKADLGAYALGYKLALVVKLFSRRPLYMVWSARMYEAARQPDAPTVFGKVFTRMLAAEVCVGLALCLVAEEAVTFLTGCGYAGGAAGISALV